MTIQQINNGESGLSARTKINESIVEANKVENKMDKVPSATENSLAAFDAAGQVKEADTNNSLGSLKVDSITFDPNATVTITDEGTVLWNGDEYTIDVITGLGSTIQVGQEILILVYNNTGSQTNNGKILHPVGSFESGVVGITYENADAAKWETCQGTLIVATHNIPDGTFGLATRFGKVRGLNTSGFTGAQLFLTDDGSGDFTETQPQFPSYRISMGGSIKIDASDGEIFVSVLGTERDTFDDAWDGAIRESFDFRVTSDGVTVTGTLTNSNDPTSDLNLLFSSGFYTFDTTPGATIALTAGTDTSPQTNYVYILESTKALTISTSGFPIDEHCKVAILEVQSPTTVNSEGGAIRNQNINDHIKEDNDNGHILHIAERLRQFNAQWDNGTEATLTGTPTNGYLQITSGQVWQMHKQTYAAKSMPTDNAVIVNDSVTAFRRTNNLNTINAYSTGSSWNNEWSKIVVWGVANKTSEPSYLMVNLPSAGYNSESNAISDASNYANFNIPNEYKGVGFLIGAFVIRISGGSITYNGGAAYQDLRGFFPNTTAGGAGGGSGITTFLGLSDTPSSFVGQAGNFARVNSGETALEFDSSVWVTNEVTPAVSTSTLTFDFDSEKACFATKSAGGAILIDENITVAYSNATNFRILTAIIQIQNASRTLTFPTDHKSSDTRWTAGTNGVLTLDPGFYQFSVIYNGSYYSVLCSQAEV